MKCYYDLHIHTALSPCADDDMTPANIAGMAALKGLDFIAVTDHNSAKNCRAVITAAKEYELKVIAGMELTTSEEIHVLCFFYEVDDAENFSGYVENHRMHIENKPEIFGRQLIVDAFDNIIGEEKDLLIIATDISVNDISELIKQFKGICVPAHIDKESNSMYSILGDMVDCEYGTVEIAGDKNKFLSIHPELKKYSVVTDSDSHTLGAISEQDNYIELKEITVKSLLDALIVPAVSVG